MKKITTTLTVICLSLLSPAFGQWHKNILEEVKIAAGVDVADLDGDAKPDIIVSLQTPDGKDHVFWYQNDYPNWKRHTISNLTATFVYTGDMDSDGDFDVVASLYFNRKLIWYENELPATTWTRHDIDGNTEWSDLIQIVDVDNNGTPDIVTAPPSINYNHPGPIVWYQNNNLSWTKRIIEPSISGVGLFKVDDINDDGIVDVIVGTESANALTWYKTDNMGISWTRDTIDNNLVNAYGVNTGDINGDDRVDIVATTGGAYLSGSDVVWYENNYPTWTKHIIDTSLPGAYIGVITDVYGDGSMDIVASGFRADDIVWYDNNLPDTVWTKHVIDDNMNAPRLINCQDLDENGVDEILVPGEGSIALYTSTPLGIKDPLETKIRVTPNPASGSFNMAINKTGDSTIKIYNSSGRCIYTQKFHTGIEVIDVSTFSQGIYFIKVIQDKTVFGQEVVLIK